jgi:GNAT superfamily N-acetyltransferase
VPGTSDPAERAAPANAGWWQCIALGPDRKRRWFAVVTGGRHPDGARLELPVDRAEQEIGADAICTATYDDEGRVGRLQVGARSAPKAPPLWFVEVRESTGAPPAVNLVAFTGHGVPPGSLRDDTGGTSATTTDQVGAVRWYPATGEVDQIYVQPAWRRRTVGNALIGAAAALSYARDWPRLWGDGQRTRLGEQFRNAAEWRHRTADLTHLAPPMTPGDE